MIAEVKDINIFINEPDLIIENEVEQFDYLVLTEGEELE